MADGGLKFDDSAALINHESAIRNGSDPHTQFEQVLI